MSYKCVQILKNSQKVYKQQGVIPCYCLTSNILLKPSHVVLLQWQINLEPCLQMVIAQQICLKSIFGVADLCLLCNRYSYHKILFFIINNFECQHICLKTRMYTKQTRLSCLFLYISFFISHMKRINIGQCLS